MGWIDVAIPGVIGMLLLLAPGLFSKPTGSPDVDDRTIGKLRKIGALLLVVAGLYLTAKLMMPH